MKRSLQLCLVVTLSLIVACATTGPEGKKSVILIPTAQEVAIGQGMAEQVAQTEQALPDSMWQSYLAEVGNRIVAVCDRNDIEYRFTVIESDQVNAFAAPGGFVYFYTGLLERMETEAQLAAVMAHEISHVVARHGIKRLQASMGVALAYELAVGDNSSEVLDQAIGIGMTLAFAGYSRENEREADDFGFTYMVRAGYDPHGMEEMFHVLAAAGGGDPSSFEQLLSSHPATQERIANAQTRLAEMGSQSNLETGRQRYQQMLERLN